MMPIKISSSRNTKYKSVFLSLRWDTYYCPSQVADFAQEMGFLDLIHPNMESTQSRERIRIAMRFHTESFPSSLTVASVGRQIYTAWPGYQWAGFRTKALAATAVQAGLNQLLEFLPRGVAYSIADLAEHWSRYISPPSKVFIQGHNNWREDFAELSKQQLFFSLTAFFRYLAEEKTYLVDELFDLGNHLAREVSFNDQL